MGDGNASLIRPVQKATHDVGDYLAAVLPEAGLTQGEIHVLSFLAERGASSIGSIQESFSHRRSTLTGVLDRLEGRGLVTRTINPADRRSFVIATTKSGEVVAGRAAEAIHALEARATEKMGEPARAALLEGLSALSQAAEELASARRDRGDRGRA
jgi:DNA-binding MarR family transcriptional regulator